MAAEGKRACLVFVAATADMRQAARSEFEKSGYIVCEVESSPSDAETAKVGGSGIPQNLADCIHSAELCVFLLPEDSSQDAGLEGGASASDAAGRPIIGIVAGARVSYPQAFEENAESMLRNESTRLTAAIGGEPTWEDKNGARAPDREITRVRCQ